jgi:hydroxyacylglutathione hydrolase
MGAYQTNCYIVTLNGGDIIIDPGIGAVQWVLQNVKNPIAIFNTHGHFDHIWSNAELKASLNIPIYCPKDDEFMLRLAQFGMDLPASFADILVEPNQEFNLGGSKIIFHHFAGHTPGCSMIEIGNVYFSGDFIFKDSIGRTDFEYSSPKDMAISLTKFATIQNDNVIYPGHGEPTTVMSEQKNTPYWLRSLA